MALVRWRPSLLSPVERLFDDLMAEREGEGLLGTWNPRVNMYEKGDNLIVEAELPGVKKEDIDVRLEDRQLTLRGECREEKETKEDDYFRRERRYGSFTRSLTLPSSVTGDKVEASYKDGILRLTLPKTEEAKGKQISIE
jgi:HSP20 family protein